MVQVHLLCLLSPGASVLHCLVSGVSKLLLPVLCQLFRWRVTLALLLHTDSVSLSHSLLAIPPCPGPFSHKSSPHCLWNVLEVRFLCTPHLQHQMLCCTGERYLYSNDHELPTPWSLCQSLWCPSIRCLLARAPRRPPRAWAVLRDTHSPFIAPPGLFQAQGGGLEPQHT